MISKALEDEDTDYEKEERVLHQIKQSTPQLRELQEKLRNAELFKKRHQDVLSYS